VEDYTDGYMQALAMVHSNGEVFWPPIVKFQSTCQVDITFFPFDDQICSMKLGSWAYDGFQGDSKITLFAARTSAPFSKRLELQASCMHNPASNVEIN
ncbi:nicotinic acetylcholine receptor subunit type D, partial [Biomphalaria glabrata]